MLPFQGDMLLGLTRRVAAGWLVLLFQGGGKKTYCPFNENSRFYRIRCAIIAKFIVKR
jgi:hypothetical protein